MNNLGVNAQFRKDYAEARDWFGKSMQLCREVGDAWMVAIGHNNLGNATRGLGDYASARKHYAASLLAYRDYGDRWALAFLLEDIAVLAALTRDASTALELLGAADVLRSAIGAPRAPSVDEEITAQIAESVSRLTEADRLSARARGQGWTLDLAIERSV